MTSLEPANLFTHLHVVRAVAIFLFRKGLRVGFGGKRAPSTVTIVPFLTGSWTDSRHAPSPMILQ
jgi:hypothetical protein